MPVNTTPRRLPLHKQAGYTIMELSIAVGIIAVLIAASLYGVPRIMDTMKTNELIKGVSMATANYSKMAAQNSNGATNSFADAAAYGTTASGYASMGLWPDSFVVNDSTGKISVAIQHPFNGYIYSKNYNGTAMIGDSMAQNTGYIIKLENIPSKQCSLVASAFANTAYQIGIVGGTARATAPVTVDAPTVTKMVKSAGGSLDSAELAKQCVATATGAMSAIYLWFLY